MNHYALWDKSLDILPQELKAIIELDASIADQTGSMTEAVMSGIKETDYLRAVIPKQFGGRGLNLWQTASLQRELAMLDPGVAVGLNMHVFTIGIMVEHWLRHRDISWMLMQAIAKNNQLVASAFAEPQLGGSLLRSHCKAVPTARGFLVSGIKVPCSIADRSDMICFQAETDDKEREDNLLVGLVARHTPGISVRKGPELLGMKSSESDVLVFESCFVPQSLILHRTKIGVDETDVFKASLIWFAITASAVYLGLVEKAFQEATQILKTRTLPPHQKPRAAFDLYKGTLGQLYSAYVSVDVAVSQLARQLSSTEAVDESALPQALSLKQATYRMTTDVLGRLLDLVGGGDYSASSRLMKLFRDGQAIRFHPPTPLSIDLMMGEFALTQRLNFDPYDS